MTLQSLIKKIDTISSVDELSSIKACVEESYAWINASFDSTPVNQLVTGRAQFVDALLSHLWQLFGLDTVSELSLCAVGGYGRGHLQPHSDIDLLIVSKKSLKPEVQEKISLLQDLLIQVGDAEAEVILAKASNNAKGKL